MGSNCLICHDIVRPPPGPASSKKKAKVRKGVPLPSSLTRSQSVTLCKALNIPEGDFKNFKKYPTCLDCCKKVTSMSHIVTALENLQNTVRDFRSQIMKLLATSYQKATIKQEEIATAEEVDPLGEEILPELVLVQDHQGSDSQKKYSEENLFKEDQNKFRKQILDILERRHLRTISKEKPAAKKSVLKSDNNSVPSSQPLSLSPSSSPSKKIKIEPGFEDAFKKQLIIPLERVDKNPIEKSPKVNVPIVSESYGLRKSVTFTLPADSIVSNEGDGDDEWLPPSSSIDYGDGEEDDTDFGNFSDEFNEPDIVIMPSPDDDEDSNLEMTGGANDTKKGSGDDEGNKSNVEASAYFDTSDSDEDNDLAPSKKKKYSKSKLIGKYYCKICKRNFKNDFVLSIHTKRRHLGVKNPFECTEEGCTKSFRQRYLWKHHIEEHKTGTTTLNRYICEHCGKKFSTNNSMQRHASSHTGKWKYPCTFCPKGFHRPGELETHLQRHRDPMFRCQFCKEEFDKKYLLTSHILHDHPDQDFKDKKRCDICSKAFSGNDALRCHKLQIHQIGEFAHTCEICGQGFAKQSWLIRHQLTHSMEKTFACTDCPDTFRFAASLRVHKMKHDGRYPHACKVCDKKFTLRQQLKQHETTHTKEKPFMCEYCGKNFANRFYLTLHVKRLHWEQIGLDDKPKYLISKSNPNRYISSTKAKKPPSESKAPRKKYSRKSKKSVEESNEEMISAGLEEPDHAEEKILIEVEIDALDDEEVSTQKIGDDDVDVKHEIEVTTQRIEEMETQQIELETEQFIEFVVNDNDK